jgi:hypothetical protein
MAYFRVAPKGMLSGEGVTAHLLSLLASFMTSCILRQRKRVKGQGSRAAKQQAKGDSPGGAGQFGQGALHG